MTDRARAVLAAVAEIEVAGQGEYADEIARRADLPDDEVRNALDELRDQHLVQELRGDDPDLGPRFVVKRATDPPWRRRTSCGGGRRHDRRDPAAAAH